MGRAKVPAPSRGSLHHSLRLQHRHHTGKLLHHRHTSFRGLAVILVLATAFIVGLNVMARVTADSLNLYVYGRIPAPIPTDAPVILSPKSGFTTKKAEVTVTGTCPVITPQVVIAIIDNGQEVGSAPCDPNNNFSIGITLVAGDNDILARSFTITGDAGPDSNHVSASFIPTHEPAPLGSSSNSSATNLQGKPTDIAPLALTATDPFVVFGPAKDAIWTGSIDGGIAPYTFHIDWGDGSSNNYLIKNWGAQHFQHHYTSMQPHDIMMHVTDNSGQYLTRHYAAVTPYVAPVASVNSTAATRSPWEGVSPFGMYGLYLMLLALFGWLWVRAHAFAYAPIPVYHRRYANPRATHRRRSSR
jgi:hypothetical protein